MRPRPLNHRSDLVAVVRQYAPTRACERAIDEGRTTVLGGFTPPGDLPYWLVRVESRFGRVWLIALVADQDRNELRVNYPSTVIWADWTGNPLRKHPVYDGDDPLTYDLERRNARAAPQST